MKGFVMFSGYYTCSEKNSRCKSRNNTISVHPIIQPIIFIIVLVMHSFAEDPQISIKSTLSKSTYGPGDTVLIALNLQIPTSYHLYDNPMGPGIGKPMNYYVEGEAPIEWHDLLKTRSKKYQPEIGDWVKAFEGEQWFFIRGIVKSDAAPGSYLASASVTGLMCHLSCYPVNNTSELTISITTQKPAEKHFNDNKELMQHLLKATVVQKLKSPEPSPALTLDPSTTLTSTIVIPTNNEEPKSYTWNYFPQNVEGDLNIFLAVVFGFLAGIILNAMPCVLPVLGVKILSFANGANLDRKKALLHGIAFSAGVIVVFVLLASLASFANFSWGKQFQDPKALIAIIAIIVVFALGMFDIYMITVPGNISDTNSKKQDGMFSDFLKGVFATILATPCSGPFLGAVLAWSITQPPYIVFIVYISIGLGMSFPFLLLSSIPKLAKILPKPGNWMNDFKMVLGFFLLGFAVYLMIGLPQDLILPTVLFCVLISFTVILYTRIAPWGSAIIRKLISFTIALMMAGGSFYVSFMLMYPSFSKSAADAIKLDSDHVWQDFHPDSLIQAHKQGRPVIVDFTAAWCMNCQYNYIMVLTKKEITDLIKEKNVLALKVDMTSPDPIQDSLLHNLGSQSIPFLALFPGDSPREPIVMRDVVSIGQVKRALEKL